MKTKLIASLLALALLFSLMAVPAAKAESSVKFNVTPADANVIIGSEVTLEGVSKVGLMARFTLDGNSLGASEDLQQKTIFVTAGFGRGEHQFCYEVSETGDWSKPQRLCETKTFVPSLEETNQTIAIMDATTARWTVVLQKYCEAKGFTTYDPYEVTQNTFNAFCSGNGRQMLVSPVDVCQEAFGPLYTPEPGFVAEEELPCLSILVMQPAYNDALGCPDMPDTVVVGSYVQTNATLKLTPVPGINYPLVKLLDKGTTLWVLRSNICVDHHRWIQVVYHQQGDMAQVGWIVEMTSENKSLIIPA